MRPTERLIPIPSFRSLEAQDVVLVERIVQPNADDSAPKIQQGVFDAENHPERDKNLEFGESPLLKPQGCLNPGSAVKMTWSQQQNVRKRQRLEPRE